MTDHQRARRARKSKLFFAKLAARALLERNTKEAQRLVIAATRKGTTQRLAEAVMVSAGDYRKAA